MRLIDKRIDSFVSKIGIGVTFFQDAGELLVEMLEDGVTFEDILATDHPMWLTLDVLKTFEMVGRKQLAVEAMFLPAHVSSRLVGLPVEEQAKIATEPVPVVPRRGTHHTTKPAAKLTPLEAKAAIGPTGIRPIEEQKQISPNRKSLGKFEVVVMNNKPFIKHYAGNRVPVAVALGDDRTAVIEVFESI